MGFRDVLRRGDEAGQPRLRAVLFRRAAEFNISSRRLKSRRAKSGRSGSRNEILECLGSRWDVVPRRPACRRHCYLSELRPLPIYSPPTVSASGSAYGKQCATRPLNTDEVGDQPPSLF